MGLIGIVGIIFWGNLTLAQVDIRHGSYKDNFLDFIIMNSEQDIRLTRSYSSRSLDQGWFGWGWCSNYEAKLKFKKRQVIYKDCQLEVTFKQNDSLSWYNKAFPEIQLLVLGKNYIVKHIDGSQWKFDENGRLLSVKDRSNRKLKFKYLRTEFQIRSHDNIIVKFLLGSMGNVKKVKVISSKSLDIYRRIKQSHADAVSIDYNYSDGNLINVSINKKTIYEYTYNQERNLSLIKNELGQFKKIEYDNDNDWVVKTIDFNGCTEFLEYWFHPLRPKDNYKTNYKKECNGKVVQFGNFEFTYGVHPVSGRFLKNLTMKKGEKTQSIEFNPISGRPVERNVSNHL